MADEVQQAQWPWVNSTNSMVQALLTSQPSDHGKMVDPASLGYGAESTPSQGLATTPTQLPIPDLLAAAMAPQHAVSAAGPSNKLSMPAQSPFAPVQQMPVKNLLALGDYQLSPQVQAAKQRMVQLLAAQQHTILPSRKA